MSQLPEEKLKKLERKAAIDALWRKGIVHWQLDTNQIEMRKFCEETSHKKIIIACSRQLGKSRFLCTYATEKCMSKPNMTVKYVAPTLKDIKKVIAGHMRDILETCPPKLRPKYNGQDHVYTFPNGSSIELAAAEKGHIDGIRGTKADLCIVDEAGFCSDLDYAINSVLLPTTTTTDGKIIIASTPARSPDHDFVVIMRDAEANGNLIRKTIYDNPRLSEKDIQGFIDACGGNTTVQFRREYLAENIIDEKDAVVPEFNKELQEKIVREWAQPSHFDGYVSMDIGFKDKTAILFGYIDFVNAKLIIEDEIVISGHEVISDNLAFSIKDKEKILWTNKASGEVRAPFIRISDNNNPILLNDLQIKHNITFLATLKDNKEAAINNMRLLIKSEKIIIHPRCRVLIAHLKGAIWNKARKEYVRSAEGGHYDTIDALVYMCRNVNFGKNPFPAGYEYLGMKDLHVIDVPNKNTSFETSMQNQFKIRNNRRHRRF